MYLTFEEYQQLGGKEELATFTILEDYASRRVNELTRNRAKDIAPMPFNEVAGVPPLKMCVFVLVEFYQANNILGKESNIVSKSNNGISISYATATASEVQNKEYSTVKTYLQDIKAGDGNSVMWAGVR